MHCALLADRHRGLSDGIRGLLEGFFEVIVMVADEASMVEAVERMHADLAVIDLSLSAGNGPDLVRRLRARCPGIGLIAISVGDEPALSRAALAAGADGFITKRAIATDLVPTVEAVLAARGTRQRGLAGDR